MEQQLSEFLKKILENQDKVYDDQDQQDNDQDQQQNQQQDQEDDEDEQDEQDAIILEKSKSIIDYMKLIISKCKENDEKLRTNPEVLEDFLLKLSRQVNKLWKNNVEDDEFLSEQKKCDGLQNEMINFMHDSVHENDMYVSMLEVGSLLSCIEYVKRKYKKNAE